MEENQTQAAPSAEASAPEPMSLDAAVSAILDMDKPQAEAPKATDSGSPQAGGAPEGDADAGGDDASEQAQAGAEQANPEAEPEEDDRVHGNLRTRLRDGTELTVGELKKSYGELQEMRGKFQQLEARVAKGTTERNPETVQYETFLTQAFPLVLKLLKESVPPPPDDDLLNSDPVEHHVQLQRHNMAVQRLRKMAGAAGHIAQRQTAQAQELSNEQLQEQHKKLLETMPELKDDARRREFGKTVIEAAKAYGYTEADAAMIRDYRLFPIIRDAAAYRKLMSEKPKADAKAEGAVPVQSGTRRTGSGERQQIKGQAALSKLTQSGSLDDAIAAAVALDL